MRDSAPRQHQDDNDRRCHRNLPTGRRGQAVKRYMLSVYQPDGHAEAPTAAATDWWQILQLYNQLLMIAPSPIVAVNRAVAVAEVEGPDAALTLLDGLNLETYYLFHAVRADMLRRLGRDDEAATAYDAAIARTNNLTERQYMQRRLDGLLTAE